MHHVSDICYARITQANCTTRGLCAIYLIHAILASRKPSQADCSSHQRRRHQRLSSKLHRSKTRTIFRAYLNTETTTGSTACKNSSGSTVTSLTGKHAHTHSATPNSSQAQPASTACKHYMHLPHRQTRTYTPRNTRTHNTHTFNDTELFSSTTCKHYSLQALPALPASTAALLRSYALQTHSATTPP